MKTTLVLVIAILLIMFGSRAEATNIFSDDFESNDYSAWTSTVNSHTFSLAASTDVANCGTYSSKAVLTNTAAVTYAGPYKTFTGQDTVFMRAYVRFTAIPTQAMIFVGLFRGAPSSWGNHRVGIGAYTSGGTKYWFFVYNNDAGWQTSTVTDSSIAADTWYCLEVKHVVSATVGEYRGYVDGVEKFTFTNQDNNAANQSTEAFVGSNTSEWYLGNFTTYADCVVVSDSYIGPISARRFFILD